MKILNSDVMRLIIAGILALSARPALAQQPIEVKVVVVTMFELGADMADRPGEFQYWVERAGFDRVFEFPQGWRNLRMNQDGVLLLCTGVGTAKAAASVMALGLDPRFDLRRAYWVVAGIAGIDPEDGSTGSAAWAEWIVDGDLAHELDAREVPADWPTGYVPLRKTKPYELPRYSEEGSVIHLDPALVDWAFRLTRAVPLDDSPQLRAHRGKYGSHAAAQMPPGVLKGDVLSASTFWHGRKLSEWANQWVKYHTEGLGNYVMTAMEDSGTLQSLAFLDAAARVDKRRVLVLRTASNFDQQRDGLTATESLAENEVVGSYSAFLPALEAAYRVGIVVVNELVRGWSQFRDRMPN